MKPRMTESEWERIVADAFSPDAPEPSFSAEYLAKRKSLERRIAMNKPKRNRVRLFKANEDAAIQKGKNAGRLLPWHIAIGITAAACAILAVSVGIDVVGRNSQMQVGTSNTTTASTQTAKREPVKIIDKLAIRGGADQVMKQVPQEGAVQVLRCVKDADAFCQYSDETINNGQLDYRQFLTEEVFAQYDVLYFGFKDKQFPLYNYRVDLTGGGIAADGKTLEVDFIALVYDPEHLPPHTLHEEDYEPYWNSYYFYKVPKGSLPDLNKLELHFDEYPIGEIPDDLLKYSNGYNTANETIVSSPLQEYLEKTQEYRNYISSVPEQVYITWENETKPPVDCDVVKESAKDSDETPQVTLPAETLESYAYARNINNMHMMQIGETAEYF